MALDGDDLKAIARLARLGLDQAAREALAAELNGVLALVEELQAVDTDGVEPLAHPLGTSVRLRDDVVEQGIAREALQRPAPAVEDGYFLVPRVIE